MTEFDAYFSRLTGQDTRPHDWQRSLAMCSEPRSRLIRIPTGMGKTLGVLAAWSWNRLTRSDERWPRRLVWCLPMRTLVEQTEAVVRDVLRRQDVLWDGASAHEGKVGVHLLMGGTDPGGAWNLYPDECAVLVGTQDMLLSRALNRGFAAGRARWPHEFGLLGQDAMWVMDEVQLMDVGLATSAQLQAFFDEDAPRGLRPRLTWWMSATLQRAWLESVDTRPYHPEWARDPTAIPPDQRSAALGSTRKSLTVTSTGTRDSKGFAKLCLEQHGKLADGEHGRITLVVCNTVDRACETFDALRALAPEQEVRLVHSRFRGAERAGWREGFLCRSACVSGADRIIVATQVVEAGVDMSAGCLVTELAPWPSLVQRFGRCARYGGSGVACVVDRGRDEKAVPPYSIEELDAAWTALERVVGEGGDVGTASLEAFEGSLEDRERAALYPYQPSHLLLRRELYELFDTTPDLTGADLDISRFIRSGDERDVLVFWIETAHPRRGERPVAPPDELRPGRNELCAIPFLRARDWLCGEETKTRRKPRLRASVRAWAWDWLDGKWVELDRAMITPGRIVCVAADCGGYRVDRGFDAGSSEPVPLVARPTLALIDDAAALADDREEGEALSATSSWKTIACHSDEVGRVADEIANRVGLRENLRRVMRLASRWHDLGKAHPAFQGAIRSEKRPDRPDLAKAPRDAWPRPPKTYRTADDRDVRPGLRHELASALALFAVVKRYVPTHPALLGPWIEALDLMGHDVPEPEDRGSPTPCERAILECTSEEFDLLAYLVASHHGKVRVALHPGPRDQDYRDGHDGRGLPIRGIRDGDVIPSIALDQAGPPLPSMTLTLEPASLGLSPTTGRSWRDRTINLLERLGPGGLAWLEALFAAADRRASSLQTADPTFAETEERSR